MAADRYLCRGCSKQVAATKNNRYRSHTGGNGESCMMSSVEIPEDLLAVPEKGPADVPVEGADFAKCPHCTRAVKLTRLGYFEPHDQTLRGGDRCPNSGVRFRPLKPTADLPLPGDEVPAKGVYNATRPEVSAQMEVEAASTAAVTATPTAAAAAPASADASPDATYERNLEGQSMAETERIWGPEESSAPEAATSGVSTETSSPEFSTTSSSSDSPRSEPSPSPTGTPPVEQFRLGTRYSATVGQPFSPFLQPPEYVEPPLVILQPPEYGGPEKPEPMTPEEKILAAQIKETFYSYSNRKSSDNRSAQTTLGPSEIGTPCDRRLAMALMGIPAVNPGGDGWASFVGTRGHTGMAEIYTFADAGTGRYAVEMPVFLGIPTVPRGTTDLLDRWDATIVDWKFMGAYSLKKFKLEGPSETYKIQAQVYGYGAERAGEKVKNVAIVGLPRAGSSLDEMHVWKRKYDRKIAQEALNRVEKIAQDVAERRGDVPSNAFLSDSPMEVARSFEVASKEECRYCPFHLKGDKEMGRGCPGP